MKVWIIAAVAVVVLAVAGFAIAGNPFAPSVNERVSDDLGVTQVSCRKAGFQVVAGERERIYNCSYQEILDGKSSSGKPVKRYHQVCAALLEDEVYGVPC